MTGRGGADALLDLVEDARERERLDVTFDSYPYVYGSTRLLIVFPNWIAQRWPGHGAQDAAASGGPPATARRSRRRGVESWHEMWLTYFKQADNHQLRGAHRGRSGRDDGQASGRRDVRPAAGRGPAGVVRLRRRQRTDPAEVRLSPDVDGRQRRAADRRLSRARARTAASR